MPDFKTSFRSRLTGDVVLGALADAGVDWGKRPDLVDLDGRTAIVMQTIALPNDMHFTGPQTLLEATVQIDCFSGLSIEAGDAAARRVIAILQSPEANVEGIRFDPAFVDGPEDSGNQEETLYVHRSRLVARVWFGLA